ncbi:IS30 family transposase (plasmid) [Mycobacterium intracellulare subsp. chimaera]|nr:IS30 family transposase [Mycobacterium intracellulare]AOS94904.1 IS30 family transposase [Mycobacterium intracellulare subsp. chimaera]
MELRARGWSVRAAAREVGVSRSAATNWARGYKTYRNGVVVGFVPPLDRLAVREISPRYLSQDERIKIADLRRCGLSIRAIAVLVGRAASTISRELRRNAAADCRYQPFEAHRRATARRARHHRRRLDTNDDLSAVVTELLGRRWSPQQISRNLRLRFPGDPSMRLCHESIYQAVYQPNSRFLRPSRLAPHRRSPLRTGRDHRRAHQCQQRRRPRFQQPMLTIHDRPFPPVDRSQAGHWEGDLIIGDNHLSAIGTLVERQSRMLRLVHLPRADSDSVHAALVARMQDLPRELMRSITWDQGTEMARHLATADKLGAPVYFCDSRSPWQRGSNENTNGLLRDYFPKGVTLRGHSPEHLLAVENELNNRPRMILQDRCPADLFATLLASESPSVLRR